MSVYTDDLPPGVTRLRIRGEFKLNKAPHGQIEGWDFFHMNSATVDWAESCNAARAQLFPNVKLPVVDLKFEAIMRARLERDKAAA